MARVLLIIGSRREGNSFHFAKELKKGLEGQRISCDEIIPGNQKIYLCTGCMDCDKNGVCDFNDDMVENIKKIKEAEYLVFITPTRWNLLSGDLKIFIDRLNPLYANRGLASKKMMSIIIGSKPNNMYSLEGAKTSLGSFSESSGMKNVYSKTFDKCLDFTDILNDQETLQKTINEIIDVINSN